MRFRRTDGWADTPSCRDAKTRLKLTLSFIVFDNAKFDLVKDTLLMDVFTPLSSYITMLK